MGVLVRIADEERGSPSNHNQDPVIMFRLRHTLQEGDFVGAYGTGPDPDRTELKTCTLAGTPVIYIKIEER